MLFAWPSPEGTYLSKVSKGHSWTFGWFVNPLVPESLGYTILLPEGEPV